VTDKHSQHSFSHDELIMSADGKLFGENNARLPAPPMLMFDRVPKINDDGGAFEKGEVVAELDVTPEHWFFECHFHGDPVMPGCLGLDAMWQLVGFWLAWTHSHGRGRALGVGEVKFTGQVTPDVKRVRYQIDMKRIIRRKLILGIADGVMFADDEPIYSAKSLRVGIFQPDDNAASAAS